MQLLLRRSDYLALELGHDARYNGKESRCQETIGDDNEQLAYGIACTIDGEGRTRVKAQRRQGLTGLGHATVKGSEGAARLS